MMTNSPDMVLNRDDPGDDVQLRFRYQHGYGVILLAGAVTRRLPYAAIWCEHHDDLLGELTDGTFDSYQIKTATPEYGHWVLSDKELLKSLAKFVNMDKTFPGKFRSHSFVSNVQFFDTAQAKETAKSPVQFLKAIQCSASEAKLPARWKKVLKQLAEQTECTTAELFSTCRKVKLVVGPPKEAFEAEIAHTHLPRLDGCRSLSPAELDGLRDELIQAVFKASSLAINDPSKHWCCVLGADHLNPRLRLKRLSVSTVVNDVLADKKLLFRFAPAKSTLKLQDGRSELKLLQKKMLKGGLATQFDTMQDRTLSAENHLLELTAQDADEAEKIVNQLKGVVKGACHDAASVAAATQEPWGEEMYRIVAKRLQFIADTQPGLVHQQVYECLVGVAGLLTEQCEVWWSKPFDLKEEI